MNVKILNVQTHTLTHIHMCVQNNMPPALALQGVGSVSLCVRKRERDCVSVCVRLSVRVCAFKCVYVSVCTFKVRFDVSKTITDSQWNLFYKVFHKTRFRGNEPIRR